MYKYVLRCIYAHYHGGYVFIWFRNFKKAGYKERKYSIFFLGWGERNYMLLKNLGQPRTCLVLGFSGFELILFIAFLDCKKILQPR